MKTTVGWMVAFATVSLLCSSAQADFSLTPGTFTWGSGSFTAVAKVKVDAGLADNAAFKVTTIAGSLPWWGTVSFRTFCVEKVVTFTPNQTYYATVERIAYSGNTGGGPGGDPVSTATEWIYEQWLLNGQTGLIGANNYTLAQIRDAIWALEGEPVAPNALYTAALAAVGLADQAAADASTSSGSVWALNLWTIDDAGNATDIQTHLISSVPAPGAAVLGFLGIGIIGWLKRRLA